MQKQTQYLHLNVIFCASENTHVKKNGVSPGITLLAKGYPALSCYGSYLKKQIRTPLQLQKPLPLE